MLDLMTEPFAKTRWPLFGAGLLLLTATGWLLPNHYLPWRTFHSSVWIAACLLLASGYVLTVSRGTLALSRASFFLLVVSTTPWVQYAAGALPLTSEALVVSLHLFGFAVAFTIGHNWNRLEPGQPVGYILMAACAASAVSVGLQLFQWLGLTRDFGMMDIWVMQMNEEYRPYANLGQPNQLASLQLWGVLGSAWLSYRYRVRLCVAAPLAAFILLGVALTESRTALVSLTLAVAAVSVFRFEGFPHRLRATAIALYAWYLVCLFGKDFLARTIGLETAFSMLVRSQGEVRLQLWKFGLDASTAFPWLGSGWGRANAGFFQVVENHPRFENFYFEHSHNLPLDILIWVGWPMGVLILAAVIWWLWTKLRQTKDLPQHFAFAALVVMLIHAMLELPLHHGYFLWPFALLAGTLEYRSGDSNRFLLRKPAIHLVAAPLIAVSAIVVHDYFKIEAAFEELRFEVANIVWDHQPAAPKTLLLVDWPRAIALTRMTPTSGMAPETIRYWEALVYYNTAPLPMRKLIGALTLNGRAEEGQLWARRTCWLLEKKACEPLADEWTPALKAPASSNTAISSPPS